MPNQLKARQENTHSEKQCGSCLLAIPKSKYMVAKKSTRKGVESNAVRSQNLTTNIDFWIHSVHGEVKDAMGESLIPGVLQVGVIVLYQDWVPDWVGPWQSLPVEVALCCEGEPPERVWIHKKTGSE